MCSPTFSTFSQLRYGIILVSGSEVIKAVIRVLVNGLVISFLYHALFDHNSVCVMEIYGHK